MMASIPLILSYVFDWVIIIALAAAGGGLNYVKPVHRPFSLVNLDISYPFIPETISTATLVVVSFIAPAVIIFVIALALVPGPAIFRRWKRGDMLRVKLWELEKGWAGLALSVATTFFITQGAKNLFGAPRPDLLARCNPDLSSVAAHVVGGFGQDISARWTLVTSSICQQTDNEILQDGFRSFPSGHSSFSWAGLLYLTLFICSKFSIRIPYLPVHAVSPSAPLHRPAPADQELLPLHHHRGSTEDGYKADEPSPISTTMHNHTTANGNGARAGGAAATANPVVVRNLAATPPNYLIVLALVPVAVAFYICSTRYAQYYHHGFDIIAGAFIGILTSWFSFRWYHLPVSRGQGWAWGPRSPGRAFGIGVGSSGYVDDR